jgi:GNAT superfamily N-acetyltransferase
LEIEIRRAAPELAPTLTDIAHAAKRHWAYPERWIESWREVLTITPPYIVEHEVLVAVVGEEVIGFYALVDLGTHWSLDHLWVRPQHIGRGVGRRLFAHAVERAQALHPMPLRIESDPNAERFYLRMGARRIGWVPADIDGVRRALPHLELSIAPGD